MGERIRWTGDNLLAMGEFLEAELDVNTASMYARQGRAFILPDLGIPARLWVTREQAWLDVHRGDEIVQHGPGDFVIVRSPEPAEA